MRRVVIESPFRPIEHRERNQLYLRALALWCMQRGDAPYASHALLTQWLDDQEEEQRDLGIAAGLAWAPAAELVVVGLDLGATAGMRRGVHAHEERGTPIDVVFLGEKWHEWQRTWPKCSVELESHVTRQYGPLVLLP